jgi:site-specific recombinase XerD
VLYEAGLVPKRADQKVTGQGVQTRRRKVSELSYHSFRHTATTMLKAEGVSDSVARAIVGHESAAVSQAYTHMPMEVIRAALEKIQHP